MPGMLLDLVRANFSLLHLDDGFTRVMSPGRALSRPLPLLRTISAANLAYDLWDAAVFHTGWLDAERATPYCQARAVQRCAAAAAGGLQRACVHRGLAAGWRWCAAARAPCVTRFVSRARC